MVWAHAGLLNAGRCTRLKDPLVGWDDCAEWNKLENVVLEGGGTVDGDGANFDRTNFQYLLRGLLVHLDDPSPEISS